MKQTGTHLLAALICLSVGATAFATVGPIECREVAPGSELDGKLIATAHADEQQNGDYVVVSENLLMNGFFYQPGDLMFTASMGEVMTTYDSRQVGDGSITYAAKQATLIPYRDHSHKEKFRVTFVLSFYPAGQEPAAANAMYLLRVEDARGRFAGTSGQLSCESE